MEMRFNNKTGRVELDQEAFEMMKKTIVSDLLFWRQAALDCPTRPATMQRRQTSIAFYEFVKEREEHAWS